MTSAKVKIYFKVDSQDWHGSAEEGLWAERTEHESTVAYKILNSPFFSREVSFLDLVEARLNKDDERLLFYRAHRRSGHSTYMALLSTTPKSISFHWDSLQALGCTYESTTIVTSIGKQLLYSIDVPAASDIYMVYSILKKGEENGVWMFQEGHVGHMLKNS